MQVSSSPSFQRQVRGSRVLRIRFWQQQRRRLLVLERRYLHVLQAGLADGSRPGQLMGGMWFVGDAPG
jgi:hypothetical protein